MENANLASCANPECRNEFRRLGEGKLFVRPAGTSEKEPKQKALWLCPECARDFDLRFDRRLDEYRLVRHRHAA